MTFLQQRRTKIDGLICAPFTPFDSDDRIVPDLVPAYAACLRENGISGVFVNGSSGEGLMMTDDERMTMAEAWAGECDENFKLIVHVCSTSVASARKLAAHAEGLGAFAISTMGPSFPPLGSVEQLARYCEEIASAAPSTPFYYYHIPGLSRVDLPMMDFLKIAEHRIPTFSGIKFTSIDLYDLSRCSQYGDGRFDILSGVDEIMLGALSLANSEGFIGGTFNYCAPVYGQMVEAFRAGDIEHARFLQSKSQDIIEVLIKYKGNMVAGKQMMRLIGFDLGPARTPFARMSDQEFEQMTQELQDAGFFGYCNLVDGLRPRLGEAVAG